MKSSPDADAQTAGAGRTEPRERSARKVLRDVRSGKGQTALVISSGGAIAALTVALLGLPPSALIAFNHVSVHTGITKLVVGRSGTTLISSNEHAHVEEADASLISYR
jgi:broad specificity phosphatase PhoE